jgi:hypothetical protein
MLLHTSFIDFQLVNLVAMVLQRCYNGVTVKIVGLHELPWS